MLLTRWRYLLALSVLLTITVPVQAQRAKVPDDQNHFRVWGLDTTIVDVQGIRKPKHADGKLAFIAIYNGICLAGWNIPRDNSGLESEPG
jgi:hypothetical protein